MKVLHVCETIKGGIATYLNTFQALCGDTVESRFVVPEAHRDQLAADARTVTFLHPQSRPKAIAALAHAARQEAADFGPDILFFHSTFTLAALALLRLQRVPGRFLYCPHCWARMRSGEAPMKGRLVSIIEGRLAGLSDAVLNIAAHDKALAERLGYRGRQLLVENGLADIAPPAGPSPFGDHPGRISLLFVGRFERQKGLDILLDAFAGARRSNPSLHLHVVGAQVHHGCGPVVAEDSSITFHSWVPASEVATYYANADLMVMPSRWEGLPMVLIEALRAGTPVMLPDTSGLGDLIEDGASGIVVAAPEPALFEAALAALDPARLLAMRPRARARYEARFNPARFREETLAALRTTLGGG